MSREGVIIQGLDLIDVIRLVVKKNKKFQAILLNELETIMDKNSPEFRLARKAVLDNFNDFTRSVVRDLFGEVEDLINDEWTNKIS